jgi:predicted nucleic acid-binding protein
MRVALDSNVIIYAEGVEDPDKRDIALQLASTLKKPSLVVPIQVLGETLFWLVKKGKRNRADAMKRISEWIDQSEVQITNDLVFNGALELFEKHQFQVWDAVILSAAAVAKASILLSEDMQDGFNWRGVTIRNPFALKPSPEVQKLLRRNP